MSTIEQGLVGRTLVGVDGNKIGRIEAIYVNDATEEPEWVAIHLGGLLGSKLGFAPVREVSPEGDHAVINLDKKLVSHAPTTRSEGALSPDENDALYRYYHLDQSRPAGSRTIEI